MNISPSTRSFAFFFAILIAFGFFARLLPHLANVAPIGALALFGALYLPRRYALIVPLAGLFLSDVIIGFYTWQTMVSVYVSFVIIGLIGLAVRKHKSFTTITAGTFAGSIIFFLITNMAVWAFDKMYPLTWSGLVQSYTMALPFFRNSLIGDMFYTTLLVGSAEAIQYAIRKRSREVNSLT